MNTKLALNIVTITRKVIFNFSKNPFDRFNKNKPKQNAQTQKTEPSLKDKPQQKPKTGRQEKPKPSKLQAKAYKDDNLKSESKQQSTSSAFKRFNARRRTPSNQYKQSERFQRTNFYQSQQQQQANNSQQLDKQKKTEGDQTHRLRKSRTKSTQFSKFSKQSKTEAEAQKQDKEDRNIENSGRKQKKNQPFQKITLQFNEEQQAKDKTSEPIILRKPKNYTNKNLESQPLKQDKQQPSVSQMNPQQNNQEKKPELTEQQLRQKQLWEKLQKLVSSKLSTSKKILRIERNINKMQPKTTKSTNQSNFFFETPLSLRSKLLILFGFGVGFSLFHSRNYFRTEDGKEVDPQYLKQALSNSSISQTWFHNIEFPSKGDEQPKGKNVRKYVYIKQNNGQVCYCISNQQFQKIWLQMIADYNLNAQRRAGSEMFHSNSLFSAGYKKIMIAPTRQSKKSSLVEDTRSFLSLVLLFLFLSSLREFSRNAGGKGTKGISNLFQNQKSHRFKETINVTFKDVVGMQKAKEEIVEFIDFLKYPAKYNDLGAKIPKGALLTGPPGTGKTLIAKACAGESKVPFFTISGSEFIEMYVGVGAQRVRNLFKEAKQQSPSIIFIDEIDAVGKKRSGNGGNDQRDTTLNQLLVQMDGFDSNTNVIVFAATNQKQVLDAALTRPGRFDRMIEIDLPDLQGRREIFEVHLKPLHLDQHIQIKEYARRLATLTPGFSGADIKNVCNEAAIVAARNNKQSVSIMDFQLATERIIGGVQKKSQLITPQTRKVVAYHECGHGVVSWFIKNANPLLKLTIIPRSKGALGFAQYLPTENQIFTKVKLLDQICVILGGRICQQVFFNKISTGASDDLNKAYQIAKTLITTYGFSDKLGWINYEETEYAKEYSKEIEGKIDAQILEIMKVCTERTRKLIIEKKAMITSLAEKLLQLQTIDQTIIESILGERPFKPSKQHQEFIKERKRLSQDILDQENNQNQQPPLTIAPTIQNSQKPNNNLNMKRSDYLL